MIKLRNLSFTIQQITNGTYNSPATTDDISLASHATTHYVHIWNSTMRKLSLETKNDDRSIATQALSNDDELRCGGLTLPLSSADGRRAVPAAMAATLRTRCSEYWLCSDDRLRRSKLSAPSRPKRNALTTRIYKTHTHPLSLQIPLDDIEYNLNLKKNILQLRLQ